MAKTVRVRGERREPLDKQRFLTALVVMARLKLSKTNGKEQAASGGDDAK